MAPLTPNPDGYASVKTPDGHVQTSHDAASGVSPWSSRKRSRAVGLAAQFLIVACMVLYVFGQVAYYTPVYKDEISGTLKQWWGVPTVQPKASSPTPTPAPTPKPAGGSKNNTMASARGNSTTTGGRDSSAMAGNNTMTSARGNSTTVGDHEHGNSTVSAGGRGNNTMVGDRGNSTMGGSRGNTTMVAGGRGNSTADSHAASGTRGNATSVAKTSAPPATTAAATAKGHSEMVLPTYFFLFGMLPLLVSGLLIEFLRHYNVRRLSSQYVLKVALVLRRKPALFGRVSYWSYGEWLFFLAVVGGNFYVFYQYFTARLDKIRARSKTGTITFTAYVESIGLTFGFSCIFNLAFLFLPATRNSAWMEFFNLSYANGIKYHRWLGVVTVLTGFLHCVGYYWSWLRQGTWKAQALPCFDCSLAERKGYKVWINVFGEIALLIFLVIGVTSIPIVRRKCYNLFYYAHQLLFLAVIFTVMHWANSVYWIFPTFIIYCFSRAVSMTSNFAPVQVKELTAIDDDIVKVVLTRSPGRDGHYCVGQFLYLNVPAISKLQWHAFTIASSPKASPTTVTVLLKSLGDWTSDLVTHANECKANNVLPMVYVDGFYGASLELYDEYSTVLLVGGGIGATPMFAILDDLAAKLASHETPMQKVVFVFSFRELALLEEVHPVLLRLQALDPHEQYFTTHFYLTRVPSDDVLSRAIDTERLAGKHIQATTYEKTTATPVALTEPLRSRAYRALALTTVVVVGVLLLLLLEFGGGKIQRGTNRYLWPLQQFVDPSVAMVTACVVFACVFAERLSKRRAAATVGESKEVDVFQSVGTPAFTVSDIHTYRDLLSHYKVVQGERPDLRALVTETYAFHTDATVSTFGKSVVGVFVSGPEAMKRSIEYAVHGIGAQHFDMHEEEFEM